MIENNLVKPLSALGVVVEVLQPSEKRPPVKKIIIPCRSVGEDGSVVTNIRRTDVLQENDLYGKQVGAVN